MKIRYHLLFLVIIMILSNGCNTVLLDKTPAATVETKPENGKATVIGKVISKVDGKPLKNQIVRLAEVYRQEEEGAYVLDVAFSPGARTDDNGNFIFENITAMEYVLVIGDVYLEYEIIQSDGGKAKVWHAQPDEILDIGTIETKLSP